MTSRSYETNGDLRLLEVKTTRGPATTAFYVTPNELEFSRSTATNHVLIRVFGYDDATDSGRYYEARGPLDDSYELVASEYRARLTQGRRGRATACQNAAEPRATYGHPSQPHRS